MILYQSQRRILSEKSLDQISIIKSHGHFIFSGAHLNASSRGVDPSERLSTCRSLTLRDAFSWIQFARRRCAFCLRALCGDGCGFTETLHCRVSRRSCFSSRSRRTRARQHATKSEAPPAFREIIYLPGDSPLHPPFSLSLPLATTASSLARLFLICPVEAGRGFLPNFGSGKQPSQTTTCMKTFHH